MEREVQLYDKTALDCSRIVAKNYSTSFYLGIQFLEAKYRLAICAIYAFLRYADEIVDTFLDADREKLLEKFMADTYEAIDSKLSSNPVLHAFQLIVNRYKIEKKLVDAFFRSMAMDLDYERYERNDYETYIHGSAEIVGLMCLRVFTEHREELYDELSKAVCCMGSALQKVNFLRDMKSDFEHRGRCYFPGVSFKDFDEKMKKKIEEEIDWEFDQAYAGIHRLPDGARPGVEITYLVYRKLHDKIKGIPATVLVRDGRVSQSKWFLLFTDKFLYMWINVLTVLSATVYCLVLDRSYFYKLKEVSVAVLLTAAFFIPWDTWFSQKKVWSFNQRYIIGFKLFGLPLEECLFFVAIPFGCMYIYEFSKLIVPRNALDEATARYCFNILLIACCAFGMYFYKRIYTRVVTCSAIAALVLHFYLFEVELFTYVLVALALHYVPFFLVNGILTGGFFVEEAVVSYDKKHFSNIRILSIPVEDTVYSLALMVLNVTLYECLRGNAGGKMNFV